jgi:hypothetical protein
VREESPRLTGSTLPRTTTVFFTEATDCDVCAEAWSAARDKNHRENCGPHKSNSGISVSKHSIPEAMVRHKDMPPNDGLVFTKTVEWLNYSVWTSQ